MSILNRKLLLNTLIKQGRLTISDIGQAQDPLLAPNKPHLQLLLDELEQDRHIQKPGGTVPRKGSFTDKGFAKGNPLRAV